MTEIPDITEIYCATDGFESHMSCRSSGSGRGSAGDTRIRASTT